MLLNRYARQQRLNPNEQTSPEMRSMMDAVSQVYAPKEDGGEQVSTEEVPTEENTDSRQE